MVMNKKIGRVYIKTYGCQMNFYDSEKIKTLLINNGYEIVDSPEIADFVAVNSCSVRKHAEDRAMAFLSSHAYLRKEGKILCLFGCTANLHKEKLLESYPFIDIICGAGNYKRLPEILATATGGISCTGDGADPFIEELPVPEGNISAFVTVTKGCENFCSYCVVPFARGRFLSRKPEDICREVEFLTAGGVREIILLGQNVNEYGKDTDMKFTGLLEKIHDITGIARMGFLTSHPKDIPDELIRSFKNLPKLYKHLHLPLQSGSDRILKLMNRNYTLGRYLEIVEKARDTTPDITITSDIITGFPSETEKDFGKTCSAVEDIEFDDLFIFKYSERAGTAASRMEDNVPGREKERRHKIILDIQEGVSLKKNIRLTGKTDSVFVVKTSSKRKGAFLGRSSGNKSAVFVSHSSTPGTLETVVFNSADRRYLFGISCGGNKK